MAINYPNGVDVFAVPSLPEETSLSSAGLGGNTRNHTQLHDDINKAVVALQTNAAKKGHDHSGDPTDTSKGAKLKWTNTHEQASPAATLLLAQATADTDASALAIHHTLGNGPTQAAPGNHTHEAHEIPQNYQICTSTTQPSTPWLGMMIFETDTNQLKIWAKASSENSPSWHILFGATAAAPPDVAVACRLRQGITQTLNPNGSVLEWHEELEDTLNFFNPASSLTSIVIRRPGLYQVDCAVQWDPQVVPDIAKLVLCIDGNETAVRSQQFMRGNLSAPGFSQTLSVSGKIRFRADEVLTAKVSFTPPGLGQGLVLSYVEKAVSTLFDTGSKVTSRIDVIYTGS